VAKSSCPEVNGRVTVIGPGGLFIRTLNSQPNGTVLHLKLTEPSATFELECTVRTIAERGLGAEITSITLENEQKLLALLVQLRR
jgi:hypothetical protein